MLPSDHYLKCAAEEHFCPHCNTKLSCCQCPPIHVGDGLGWGTEVFFICLNDECKLFVNGWQQCSEIYGHSASCRYALLPGEKEGITMMVGSKEAFTGCEINTDALQAKNTRHKAEQEALAALDTCVAEKNLTPLLTLLLDESADRAARHRAADLLVTLNDPACIDPLRNHSFRLTDLEQKVNLAIGTILKANFSKECPQCTEIVKAQAKVCKHCGTAF